MKKKRNKNYTMYWFIGISGVITIPAAIIIINSMDATNLMKTIAIMATFLVVLFAIILLYKYIFGVSVVEITAEEKMTELDRIDIEIERYTKQYRNTQILRDINIARTQIQKFKKRRAVLLQVAGGEEDETSAITDIIQTVEDALIINLERLSNRIEIFDDDGMPEVVRANIEFINNQLWKNNEILIEFESLITEMSRIGEVSEEKDVTKLRDMVNAMQSLRTTSNSSSNSDINDLTKKYEGEIM